MVEAVMARVAEVDLAGLVEEAQGAEARVETSEKIGSRFEGQGTGTAAVAYILMEKGLRR